MTTHGSPHPEGIETGEAGKAVPVHQTVSTDGEPLRTVRVDSPTAVLCADLYSLATDLAFIVNACGMSIELQRQADRDGPEGLLLKSLWTSALISYGRCFNTGVRGHLTMDDVNALGQGASEVHSYYKGMRDKHVAHSVNPFETVLVGAILPPPGTSSPDSEIGIAVSSVALTSDTIESLNQFQAFVTQLHLRIMHRLEAAQTVLQKELRDTGVNALSLLPDLTHVIPGAEHVTTNRRRY